MTNRTNVRYNRYDAMGRQRRYEMVNYDLRVEKQQIFGADKIAVAANANETVSFRFYFDASWRIFDAKAAIFRTAQNKYYIIEIKSSSATVPWEVLTVDSDFELSVIGYDGSTVLTAGKVDIRVASSLLPDDYKTFSASETLFDKFKQESLSEAYKKYEDEINSIKRDCEKKLVEMGTKITDANENTKNVEKSKNDEIAKIKQAHAEEINRLNAALAEADQDLAAAKIKADNWDLVDAAMSDKARSNFAPWTGGTKEYKLPFFNTKSMSVLSTGNFDGNVSEIGLDLTSATSLSSMFSQKKSLRKIELRNTDKITTIINCFSNSLSLREVTLGNLTSCINAKQSFYGDTSLEKVTIGNCERVQDWTQTFYGCIALKEIDCELNMTLANSLTEIFEGCTSLQKLRFVKETVSNNLSLSSCQSLTKESMESLFDGLASVEGKTVTVSKYAFDNNYPTADEKAAAQSKITQKGWSLVLA